MSLRLNGGLGKPCTHFTSKLEVAIWLPSRAGEDVVPSISSNRKTPFVRERFCYRRYSGRSTAEPFSVAASLNIVDVKKVKHGGTNESVIQSPFTPRCHHKWNRSRIPIDRAQERDCLLQRRYLCSVPPPRNTPTLNRNRPESVRVIVRERGTKQPKRSCSKLPMRADFIWLL